MGTLTTLTTLTTPTIQWVSHKDPLTMLLAALTAGSRNHDDRYGSFLGGSVRRGARGAWMSTIPASPYGTKGSPPYDKLPNFAGKMSGQSSWQISRWSRSSLWF